jgi:hypothetical protein
MIDCRWNAVHLEFSRHAEKSGGPSEGPYPSIAGCCFRYQQECPGERSLACDRREQADQARLDAPLTTQCPCQRSFPELQFRDYGEDRRRWEKTRRRRVVDIACITLMGWVEPGALALLDAPMLGGSEAMLR